MRAWDVVHRWSSLGCTLFVFLLCLTGLPLIFLAEIDRAMGLDVQPAAVPTGTAFVSLDRVVQTAVSLHPDKKPLFASHDAHEDRIWYVTLGAAFDSSDLVQVAVDARTAAALAEPAVGHRGFLGIVRSLHVDLFAGLPGELFLGSMGLMFLVSLVSGTVLYAPFMRKLPFGAIRIDRGPRTRWLDLHNLLGIATLTWALVVGATGAINTCAGLLIGHWQTTELAAMRPAEAGAMRGGGPARDGAADGVSGSGVAPGGGAQRAVEAAQRREPGSKVAFVAFPGSSFSSPVHHGVFLRGKSVLTSRLVRPVLVDVRSGAATDSHDLPWYLTLLFISQPLHFGDYGGLPLKVLWALLDATTLLVLGSGLYLWLVRLRRKA